MILFLVTKQRQMPESVSLIFSEKKISTVLPNVQYLRFLKPQVAQLRKQFFPSIIQQGPRFSVSAERRDFLQIDQILDLTVEGVFPSSCHRWKWAGGEAWGVKRHQRGFGNLRADCLSVAFYQHRASSGEEWRPHIQTVRAPVRVSCSVNRGVQVLKHQQTYFQKYVLYYIRLLK